MSGQYANTQQQKIKQAKERTDNLNDVHATKPSVPKLHIQPECGPGPAGPLSSAKIKARR